MSPEVIKLTERSTEDAARARADRIRRGIHDYLETVAEIALAYERRDWAVLGYADWQAYVDGEFGADRLQLPVEHRRQAVAELRLTGMSQRAIGTALGVDQATVKRDIDRAGDADASPAQIQGADGKTYPATKPRPQPKTKDTSVWVAAARKGIEAHELKSADVTVCGRSTRTGLTMLLSQAEQRYEVVRCLRCSPLDTTTTETAAGVTTAPADGADTDRVDETPALPVVHVPDVAAPAPAPPPATSPAGDGAGVTPALDESQLTVDQIARLRAVFAWARAGLARHPMSAAGRGRPCVLGREYSEAERAPEPSRDQRWPGLRARERAAHVEVSWEAWSYAEVGITYRSDRHVISESQIAVPGVDEALDVLCALGVLPARLSRQYAAGVQAGMRAGDAIDGEFTEGHPDE